MLNGLVVHHVTSSPLKVSMESSKVITFILYYFIPKFKDVDIYNPSFEGGTQADGV